MWVNLEFLRKINTILLYVVVVLITVTMYSYVFILRPLFIQLWPLQTEIKRKIQLTPLNRNTVIGLTWLNRSIFHEPNLPKA